MEIKQLQCIDDYDISAARIRMLLKGTQQITDKFITKRELSEDVYAQYLRTEIQTGQVDGATLKSLSKHFEVVNTLDNPYTNTGAIATFGATSPIIGYRLKYTGDIPIDTYRITVTGDHTFVPITIQSGQEICLSRVEMAVLSSKPEIGCTFANGKLVTGSKAYGEKYDILVGYYFTFNPDEDNIRISVYDSAIKKYVTVFVDAETVAKYFISSEKNTVQANKTIRKQESIKKRQNKIKEIFNAFKR